MSIDWNEISTKSFGGTEQMGRRLEKSLDKDLLKNFQIILSRVRDLDEDRVRILYLHDLPNDPESQHLKDEGWKKFHKIVFVSYWQQEAYINHFEIPHSHTTVIQNAIEPINRLPETPDRPEDQLNIIYHTTPHRGLEILVPVFERLAKKHDNVHLDVYSSFGVYGWKQRDEPYKPVFDKIKAHDHMTYYGYQPNEKVREALLQAHIFAYPSIWPETACLSLIEAMSAGCMCVHSDYGALPETAANWTVMYDFHQDPSAHASRFFSVLDDIVSGWKEHKETINIKLAGQKSYCDLFYNWENRKPKWEMLLKSLVDAPRKIEQPSGPYFNYNVA